MSTYLSSNTDWNPWSKKVPIDRKALLRPGKRCAFRASIGGLGLVSSAVWIDVITYPFGKRIGSGMTAILLLSHGYSRVR